MFTFLLSMVRFDLLEDIIPRVIMSDSLLNTVNRKGETVLGWILKFAASKMLSITRAKSIMGELIKKGALVTLPCFEERVPPIHLAAATNSIEMLEMVKSHGGDIMSVDLFGRSPLHFSAAAKAMTTYVALAESCPPLPGE